MINIKAWLKAIWQNRGVVTEDEESIDVDTSIDLDIVRLLSHTFIKNGDLKLNLGIQI